MDMVLLECDVTKGVGPGATTHAEEVWDPDVYGMTGPTVRTLQPPGDTWTGATTTAAETRVPTRVGGGGPALHGPRGSSRPHHAGGGDKASCQL